MDIKRNILCHFHFKEEGNYLFPKDSQCIHPGEKLVYKLSIFFSKRTEQRANSDSNCVAFDNFQYFID